jgi:hypothetical protein
MNTPQPDLIDTRILFAESEEAHVCCSCCEGYCPMTEGGLEGDPWPFMHRIEVAGVAYLTDRYVAVRADLCQPVPDSVEVRVIPAQKDAASKGFIVPEAQPPATESRITAHMWDRVDRAGLRIYGEPADGLRVLHLYRENQHVGWVMTANEGSGITRHRLSEVRRVAQAAGITLRQAEKAVWAVIEG